MTALTAEQARARRIEELVERLEAIADDGLRAEMQELMRLMLDWHGAALARLMAAAAEAPHLEAALAAWARDGEVTALCELHGVTLPAPAPVRSATFVPIEQLTARSA